MYVQTNTHTHAVRYAYEYMHVCVCVANWPRQMPHGMRFKNKPSPSQAKRADIDVDAGSSSGQNVLWLETLFSLVYGLPLHAEPGLMTTALRTCKLAARSLSLLLSCHLSHILSPLLTLFYFLTPSPFLTLSSSDSLVLSVQSLPLSLFLNLPLPLPLMLIRKL